MAAVENPRFHEKGTAVLPSRPSFLFSHNLSLDVHRENGHGPNGHESGKPSPNGSVHISETSGIVLQLSYFVGEHSIPNNGHDPQIIQIIREMIEGKYRRINSFVTKTDSGFRLKASKRDEVVAITNEIRVLSGVRGVMEMPPALGLRIRASLT